MVDDFVYHFQSFCQYRAKMKNNTEQEIALLRQFDQGGFDMIRSGRDKIETPEQPAPKTVVLKMPWHCEGCITRIRSLISAFKGVQRVQMDKAKELRYSTHKFYNNTLNPPSPRHGWRPVGSNPGYSSVSSCFSDACCGSLFRWEEASRQFCQLINEGKAFVPIYILRIISFLLKLRIRMFWLPDKLI